MCLIIQPFLAKVKNIVNMDDYVFSNRYDAEFWPGYMFGDDGFGKGLTSHNGDVLKIGHHGSKTSSSDVFINNETLKNKYTCVAVDMPGFGNSEFNNEKI